MRNHLYAATYFCAFHSVSHFLCMQLKENAPFHLEEAVNSLSRFMSSQKCSETTGSPRYSYRHYYKESLLGTAVRALFQLRHLYDCIKKLLRSSARNL